jgi:hypothetical protein
VVAFVHHLVTAFVRLCITWWLQAAACLKRNPHQSSPGHSSQTLITCQRSTMRRGSVTMSSVHRRTQHRCGYVKPRHTQFTRSHSHTALHHSHTKGTRSHSHTALHHSITQGTRSHSHTALHHSHTRHSITLTQGTGSLSPPQARPAWAAHVFGRELTSTLNLTLELTSTLDCTSTLGCRAHGSFQRIALHKHVGTHGADWHGAVPPAETKHNCCT